MAKDLEMVVNLPISDANVGIIEIVARANGWSETAEFFIGAVDENGGQIPSTVTAQYFICNLMLKAYISNYISEKISSSFDWYYGKSQAVTKALVMTQLNTELTITSEITDRE